MVEWFGAPYIIGTLPEQFIWFDEPEVTVEIHKQHDEVEHEVDEVDEVEIEASYLGYTAL